jgi:signal transduction histidine kinase
MRGRLALLAAATTSMVVIAFLIPLAILVQRVVADRALEAADVEARSLAPVVASVDQGELDRIVGSGADTSTGELTVFMPDGRVLGHAAPDDDDVALGRAGRSFTAPVSGGVAVFLPVVIAGTGTAVVRVMVPDSRLAQGVGAAWAVLAATGFAMVLLALLVADRIAGGVVGPTRLLAAASQRLAEGELETRVEPAGPPEVAELGRSFNLLAARIGELLEAEREAAADLSHRLRTPLTALRLDIERQPEGAAKEVLTADVDGLERSITNVIGLLRRHQRREIRSESDLADVTRERVRFWAALAEDQGRDFGLEVPPGGWPAPVHRDDLEAVLDALLGNVFAHTPEGTAFSVRVEEAAPGSVRLVVEDRGPGIPNHAIARGASGGGSTGLGLDIARRVAEGAGGSLTVGDREGGGARVTVELPSLDDHP